MLKLFMLKLLRLTLGGAAAASLIWSGAALAQKPLAQRVDLSGAHLTVGSKGFTEQEILGQITIELLEAAGADVTDQTGLAGSNAVRKALLSGEIDMYWECTGTAWLSYLGHTTTNTKKGHLYKQVAKQDLKQNNIVWLKPADFSDSYGIVTNQKTAKKYHLKTLDDIGKVIKNHPQDATLCVGNEFSQRDDGLRGLEKAYGWKFPKSNVSILQDRSRISSSSSTVSSPNSQI
ncbi:glycine betaine ABC transporter substrate-binding protein [Salinisphaera sp.]|uniref:glycine betaine ABC transporter substrate-binding protein n=1 Tax=Salinisphaera sp. TaxID=1914330 RepID=UPI002D7756B4|nr:glycine betaine ABC transporter substrate-binding protein [Salinisphaera sp.]HET7313017.1 glycine betaine ABC transporter substrate-binding protein [Salinisphaera sp.]